jgi:hypothetical protein
MTTPLTTCERCGHDTPSEDMTPGLAHFPTFAGALLCPDCFADERLAYDDAQPARDTAHKALDFAPLTEIMRTWPEPLRESMAGWLADACNRAGITNRRQRLALQAELSVLFGE